MLEDAQLAVDGWWFVVAVGAEASAKFVKVGAQCSAAGDVVCNSRGDNSRGWYTYVLLAAPVRRDCLHATTCSAMPPRWACSFRGVSVCKQAMLPGMASRHGM